MRDASMQDQLGKVRGLCFFLVGVPRSGTTMLRLALNSHPEICVPAETWFFLKLSKRTVVYGNFSTEAQISRFACDVARFPVEVDQLFSDVFAITQAEIAEALRRSMVSCFAEAFWALMAHFAEREGKRLWGEKTAFYTSIMPTLAQCYPEARFIFLIRDPRDIVRSLHNTPWGKKIYPTVADAALRWHAGMREVVTAMRQIEPERVLPVRYEDIVREPEKGLGRLCEFLQVEFDPAMLSFHEQTDRYVTTTSRGWHPNTFRPISDSSVGRWRETYTDEEVGLIEWISGPQMAEWGYTTEGRRLTPRNVAAWGNLQFKRVRQKVHRYASRRSHD